MPEQMPVATRALNTPIGELTLAATAQGLVAIGFPNHPLSVAMNLRGDAPAQRHLEKSLDALEDYFAGKRESFDDIKLAPEGTGFQLEVWRALYKIPYGETRSYKDIAIAVGLPKAMRAVGAANGRNPIPIIIPCHRVIGANGTLTGFGGGLSVKKWLLEFEAQRHSKAGTQLSAMSLLQ